MKKTSILVSLLAMLMLFAIVPTQAATIAPTYDIAPCHAHLNESYMDFTVFDGMADVGITYFGNASTFTQAQVTVKIQKRFLGIFWSTVDIGLPDNEWVAYNNNVSGSFYNTFPVDGTGTYRAKITLEVFGLTGVSDVIEETLEYKYE